MLRRILDAIFLFYFLSHIAIAILVDSQIVLGKQFHPKYLTDIKDWYCKEYRDPLAASPPVWFASYVWCEMTVQFVYFFIASYAFFKGVRSAKWIRVPNLIYSSHVVTTLIPMMAHFLFTDFSSSKVPGPRTTQERVSLCFVYSPYLVIPFIMLLDATFSPAYTEVDVPVRSKTKTKKN